MRASYQDIPDVTLYYA